VAVATLLLVEDNPAVQHNNRAILTRRGYQVREASNLAQARASVAEVEPDAIILDFMLPDVSGLDFLAELRRDSRIPALVLTALGTPEDIARGLRAGGDDYLPKPYDLDVFLARVEALLRRARQVPESVAVGPLLLDITAGEAFFDGADLLLTGKEFALHLLLAQNESRALDVEYLYERIWKRPTLGDTRAVKTVVSRLRAKLARTGYTIVAARGEGYLLEKW
jgi:DNA-binding response OmpR family regulator